MLKRYSEEACSLRSFRYPVPKKAFLRTQDFNAIRTEQAARLKHRRPIHKRALSAFSSKRVGMDICGCNKLKSHSYFYPDTYI